MKKRFLSVLTASLTCLAMMAQTPKADLLDVVFNDDGTATDVSVLQNQVTVVGSPIVLKSKTYGINEACFRNNPLSAIANNYYRIDYADKAEFKDGLADGHTIETLVRFNLSDSYPLLVPSGQEVKPFSSHQSGGTGIMVCKDNRGVNGDSRQEICFLPYANGGYQYANSGIVPENNVYYHIVGVWDKQAGEARVYINGRLLCTNPNAGGDFKHSSLMWFAIGGDPGSSGCETSFNGDVAIARVYDDVLTGDQVSALWNAVEGMNTGAAEHSESGDDYDCLELLTDGMNQMSLTQIDDYEYSILTSGDDPYAMMTPLKQDLNSSENAVIFEYKCPKGIPSAEFFFSPIAAGREMQFDIPEATEWTTLQVDIRAARKNFNWGRAGDFLRMDFGSSNGVTMQIRNIHIGEYKGPSMDIDLPVKNGICQLGNAEDLEKFAKYVNAGAPIDGELTADIDYSGYTTFIGNTNNKFQGTFNGAGHCITVDFTRKDNDAALFQYIQGTVENLTVKGTITTSAKYAAGIAAHTATGSVVRNCVSLVDIVSSIGGDGTHAGLVAVNEGGLTIENCIFAGSMKGGNTNSCGGIVGWSTSDTYMRNCVMIADVTEIGAGSSYTFSRNPGNVKELTNCYYLNACGDVNVGGIKLDNADMLASGEACFTLNGDQKDIHWYQTIGTDPFPLPWASHGQVYAQGELRCDGKPVGTVTYSNTPAETTIPDHHFVDGSCTVCGTNQGDFVQMVDGYYQIGAADQFKWFAGLVNGGMTTAKAKLIADIDLQGIDWMPIGLAATPYTGVFDGQGHRISNLDVNQPELQGVGLFGTVGGGANISNLILDETCNIVGESMGGLIGASKGSGTVTMTNLGNEGNVTVTNQNPGGIIGCCNGSAATFVMRDCYATGVITGGREAAALSGWFGTEGQATGCWSTAEVNGISSDETWLGRGTVTLTNCFSNAGKQGTVLGADAGRSGEMCYRLNGSSVTNPKWYQTLGEDAHPTLDSTHGVVYLVDGNYGDIHDQESFIDYRDLVVEADKAYLDEVVANVELVDEAVLTLDLLTKTSNKDEFMANYTEFAGLLTEVKASAAAYKAYQDEIDYVNKYLAENDDFSGPDRDFLQDYLEGYEEPNDELANGSYSYIIDTRTLTTDEIQDETEYVKSLLEQAIANGYIPGTEITNLLANADFSKGKSGWEGKTDYNPAVSPTTGIYGAECWNNTFDIHQTLDDLKNGVYVVKVNGAFRPSNIVKSNNYAASVYAGENMVYLPSVFETYIPVDEAEDGVNCNLSYGTNDLEVTDDEGNLIGYAMHGQISMANAAAAGRAENTILTNVTDGTLTVGIKSPGTNAGSDWTGFANVRLFYMGTLDEAEASINEALACQVARAETLLATEPFDDSNYAQQPNYQQALKDQLQAAVQAAGAASSASEKYAVVQQFSELFENIYSCKQAYIKLMDMSERLYGVASELSPDYIDDADNQAVANANDQVWDGYLAGAYTQQEAEDMAMLKALNIYPSYDENGVMQINNNGNFIFFAEAAKKDTGLKAVLNADIDYCTEAQMLGDYYGVLDGQNHTITVNINREADDAALIQKMQQGSVVENLTVRGTITTSAKFAAAVAAHTYGATVRNVASYVDIVSTVNGDGTHAGIVAVVESGATKIENCLYAGTMSGSSTTSCGGIVGWSSGNSYISNCLQIADIQVSESGSSTFSRNSGNATVTNSYYLKTFNTVEGGAIQTNEEQMASGELCYLLNNGSDVNPAWRQNLGVDAYPVPDARRQIVGLLEDGTYGNTSGSELAKHAGTAEDPYPLASLSDLKSIRQCMHTGEMTYFVLTEDIDMSTVKNWTPVSTAGDMADGKSWMNWIDFDGQGHVIRNFSIGEGDYASFFGVLCGNVRNVGFENVDVTCTVTGTGVLGGYIGHSNFTDADGNKLTSTLENVWVTGQLTGTSSYCGGLVGNVGGPTVIKNCYANLTINSTASYTGGIVGRVRDALTMQNVYAAGTISTGGGIVGGGQNAATPASTYTNCVVWNNAQDMGVLAEGDVATGISQYDGTNFAQLQQTVVGWGKPWSCDMQEGSYPVLDLTTGIQQIAGTESGKHTGIYTLTGVRVQKAQKGIYIIDGHKVLVK